MRRRAVLLLATTVMVVALASGLAWAATNPTFSRPTSFPVGSSPQDLVSADFDGQNGPDLAVTNQGSGNLSVLLNNGSGSFGTATPFLTGSSPSGVASADFDGIKGPDLAVVDGQANTVSVLLNNGVNNNAWEGFGAAAPFTVGSLPADVAIADLDGSNGPDLAVTSLGTLNVSVLLNNGSGRFEAPKGLPAGSPTSAVAIADLDGSNGPDLAVTSLGSRFPPGPGKVSVLKNTGSGSFGTATPFTVGSSPADVAIADLDGSNGPDLAVTDQSSHNVSVLTNDGSGAFGTATPFTVGSSPKGITSADFNGDGPLDLATANVLSNTVSVLTNDGTGAFETATPFPSGGENPLSVVSADFDGRVGPDLAVVNLGSSPDSGTVSVLLNSDDPVNQAPVANNDLYSATENQTLTVPNGPNKVLLANDIDTENDPLNPIQVSNPSHGELALKSDGSFTYQPNANFVGEDTFTYKVNDGQADSNVATVRIIVNADTTPPTITTTPTKDTTEVPRTIEGITAEFSEPMKGTPTITLERVNKKNGTTKPVKGTPSYDVGTQTLKFDPKAKKLAKLTKYTATVKGEDLAGNQIEERWSFTTGRR